MTKKRKDNALVMEVTIPLGATMLGGEQEIEQALNEVGALASGELLKQFDTDGGNKNPRRKRTWY